MKPSRLIALLLVSARLGFGSRGGGFVCFLQRRVHNLIYVLGELRVIKRDCERSSRRLAVPPRPQSIRSRIHPGKGSSLDLDWALRRWCVFAGGLGSIGITWQKLSPVKKQTRCSFGQTIGCYVDAASMNDKGTSTNIRAGV